MIFIWFSNLIFYILATQKNFFWNSMALMMSLKLVLFSFFISLHFLSSIFLLKWFIWLVHMIYDWNSLLLTIFIEWILQLHRLEILNSPNIDCHQEARLFSREFPHQQEAHFHLFINFIGFNNMVVINAPSALCLFCFSIFVILQI